MRTGYPRTVAAVVLTAVAVAVPCGAWFIAGKDQIDRGASDAEELVYSSSYKKGVMIAERLATRLELLRSEESHRPFYQYQNLYHDPKIASRGPAIGISPLAQGPLDPLIEAHFQIDAEGTLTLPTLNDAFPDLGMERGVDRQCELLWKLHDVAVFSNLETGSLPVGTRWRSHELDAAADAAQGLDREASEVVEMDLGAWRQHVQANDLYARLKYAENQGQAGVAISGRPLAGIELDDQGTHRRVLVEVGPFGWHTLPVGGEPALVALRSVTTPAGEWTQGFVVSSATVAQILENSSYPATFEPVPQRRAELPPGQVAARVDGTAWRVLLDASAQLASVGGQADEQGARFLRSFVVGALSALLAAVLVVALVYQSERLAQQRIQFAASAAHELRTPLAGLRLYGEMLSEGLGDPKNSQVYARRISGEAERLGRVVTNVLSFTRLERGSIPVHPVPGDLGLAVSEVCRRHRPALEESGAEVEVEIDEDLPTVSFDRDALTHILQNLLDNAEKYTRGISERRIVVSLVQESKRVVLSVADNGDGIPAKLRRRLFRPFVRGAQDEATAGLGLGLVLVKMLVQAQGAEIAYQDGPDGGAVFRVAFPVATSSTASDAGSAQASAAPSTAASTAASSSASTTA